MNKHSVRLHFNKGRNRIRIRPTRSGVIFTILMLAMFIGSLNYSNNLGFLLTFLLGSITLVSIADTYKSIVGITIGSSFAKPVFAGEKAVFEFIIGGGAISGARYGLAFEGHQIVSHDFVADKDNRIQVLAHTTSRGILKPGPLSIHSDYPLGLWRVGIQIDLNLESIVYPKPLPGSMKVTDKRSPDGEGVTENGSGSDDFSGLKSYAPGDPFQRISWRASSRGQGLFTKDFNALNNAAAFLDWHALKAADPEHKLALLCHMVLQADQHGWTYGLRLPGQNIGPGTGYAHRNRCLKALALF